MMVERIKCPEWLGSRDAGFPSGNRERLRRLASGRMCGGRSCVAVGGLPE